MPTSTPSRSTPAKAKPTVSPADRIITTKHARVEVLASPGSGKTHTLLRRIDHLLSSGVDAQKILVLTFSNAAVAEIRSRLVTLTADRTGETAVTRLQLKTAHAFALALVSSGGRTRKPMSESDNLAMIRGAVNRTAKRCQSGALWPSLSESRRQSRAAQVLELCGSQHVRVLAQLMAYASAADSSVTSALAMARFSVLVPYARVLPDVVAAYAVAKQKAKCIDYGDMLSQAVAVLTRNPAATAVTHILVDEYQDCSAAQTALLAVLARRPSTSIMVFGDPSQAVYGFTGSHYSPLADVLDNTRTLRLPVSYRLTHPVAALASAVALHDSRTAIVARRSGAWPRLLVDESQHAQTERVTADIRELLASGVKPTAIAVLGRTSALLHPIEQSLQAAHIAAERLGQRRSAQHALNVLRLVRSVERASAADTHVDVDAVSKLITGLPTNVDDAKWNEARKKLEKVLRVRSLEGRYRLCGAVYLRLRGGVRKDAVVRDDVNRWEPFARGHADAASMRKAIRAFRADAVATSTIHAAKGREWSHVLIIGATDGLLPIYLSRDLHALAEERNLMYVAITRAKQTVRIYHSPSANSRSRQRFTALSRFLDTAEVERCFRKPR